MSEFIEHYLKSKNLWKRSAGTSFGSVATSSTSSAAHTSGPVPMEVGALDPADPAARQKGKSTGQKGNQNGKGGNKGGGTKGDGKGKDKGRAKQNSSKPNAKGEYCAICGPEKGKNKGTPPSGGCFFFTIVYLVEKIESKITFWHCNLQYFMVVIYDVLTFAARGSPCGFPLLNAMT